MRVIHVAPSVCRQDAGTSYAILRLCESLGVRGLDVRIHTLRDRDGLEARTATRVTYHPVEAAGLLGRLGISRSMRRALRDEAVQQVLFHVHGQWMMPNVYPAQAAKRTGSKIVVSPHGMLSAYSFGRNKLAKWIFWRAVQEAAVRQANLLVATAESELRDIRLAGLRQPVALIPIGVDVPAEPPEKAPASKHKLLYLGRLDPKKGVDNLLRAWTALGNQWPTWHVDIAGPGEEDYVRELKLLAEELGAPRVRFLGPVYGTAKTELLHSSSLFVLPTHSENFGLVVAEALAHCVPAIVTRGAPWSELRPRRCGWWVEDSVPALQAAMSAAMALSPGELFEMGFRGRRWIESSLSWSRSAESTERAYEWVSSGGPMPEFVRD